MTGADLQTAPVVLSAGGGVRDWDAYAAALGTLGAAPAGSAVVCDGTLLPTQSLVGSSGSVVSPHVYVALGIAGLPHHLYGVEGAARIVAVNCDRHAPIVARADLTLIADVQELLPRLAEPPGEAAVSPTPFVSRRSGTGDRAGSARQRIDAALYGPRRAGRVVEPAGAREAAALIRAAIWHALNRPRPDRHQRR